MTFESERRNKVKKTPENFYDTVVKISLYVGKIRIWYKSSKVLETSTKTPLEIGGIIIFGLHCRKVWKLYKKGS